jgi:hypothetical protein
MRLDYCSADRDKSPRDAGGVNLTFASYYAKWKRIILEEPECYTVRRFPWGVLALSWFLLSGLILGNPVAIAQSQTSQVFRELLERSEKEKKGLTFFVRGQTISGIVVKMLGSDAVEVRNQTYSRMIIKLESIDALAIN